MSEEEEEETKKRKGKKERKKERRRAGETNKQTLHLQYLRSLQSDKLNVCIPHGEESGGSRLIFLVYFCFRFFVVVIINNARNSIRQQLHQSKPPHTIRHITQTHRDAGQSPSEQRHYIGCEAGSLLFSL